jgi:hypothetical protein
MPSEINKTICDGKANYFMPTSKTVLISKYSGKIHLFRVGLIREQVVKMNAAERQPVKRFKLVQIGVRQHKKLATQIAHSAVS